MRERHSQNRDRYFDTLPGHGARGRFVFFLKREASPWVQKLLLGFASGVMIAASVWSLIIPAIDMAEGQGVTPWVPAAVGFMAGIIFLLILDSVIPHLHLGSDCPEGRSCSLGKSTMLVLAVTLHNLPEGMAVGVVFAARSRARRRSPPPRPSRWPQG